MDTNPNPNGRSRALDDLVAELLDCGGVLSQLISGMVEFEASGRTPPDAAPIPEVAYSLIRSVAEEHVRGRSRRDLAIAAAIVHDVTEAICQDIYTVNFDDLPDPNMN
jgi:hypothetical protein